jgi:hypothetical protein
MGDYMFELRLGDIIDDFCVKCRRLTNHAIVSLVDGGAAKVRCRTCYHDHDYRHEQPPPSKKELKMAAEALAARTAGQNPQPADAAGALEVEDPLAVAGIAAALAGEDLEPVHEDLDIETAEAEPEAPVAVETPKKAGRKAIKK